MIAVVTHECDGFYPGGRIRVYVPAGTVVIIVERNTGWGTERSIPRSAWVAWTLVLLPTGELVECDSKQLVRL